MATIGNYMHGDNTPDTPVIKGEANKAEASIDNVVRQNTNLFKDIAVVVSPDLMKDGGTNRAIIDKAMQDRVVDLSYSSHLMKSAKLNLTSNGALLISLNDGKQLYNHPVTKSERATLDKIMNNPNLTDDMKFERLNMMLSGISMSIKLSNNFEQSYQQMQSMNASMHR